MLLGIGLHAALAFVPNAGKAWPITDIYTHQAYGVAMAAIHGFRMPLFFLLSGFFTAMLWRKRGLGKLIEHRVKRILLPLIIGMFTIIPAVWGVSIAATVTRPNSAANRQATVDKTDPPIEFWVALAQNDAEALKKTLEANTDVNLEFIDPKTQLTPLGIAAAHGLTNAANVLLDHGANIDAKSGDGSTAAHLSFFLGQSDVGAILIERDANLSIRNQYQATPVDNLVVDINMTRGIADFLQVKKSNDEIKDGREAIMSLLASQGNEQAKQLQASDRNEGWEALKGLALLACLFPVFHHLWFLWFLCWLVVGFAVYAAVMDKLKWKGPPAWLVLSPVRYAWLFALTLVPQAFMGLIYPTYGPDTSTGLIPLPHLLFYYAIFFGFGVWYYETDDTQGRVGKYWWVAIPFSLLVVFPLGFELTLGELGFADQLLPERFQRAGAVVLQVTYVWLMSFGMMGLARQVFSSENAWLRYISDSSYWLYVAHLPLVIFLQMFTRSLPIPSLLKFVLVCVVACAILLLSYEWLVRYTPIGTLLNGKKTRSPKTAPLT